MLSLFDYQERAESWIREQMPEHGMTILHGRDRTLKTKIEFRLYVRRPMSWNIDMTFVANKSGLFTWNPERNDWDAITD